MKSEYQKRVVLKLKKVSARWNPKLLNSEQKLCRQQICEKNLTSLFQNKDFFLRIFIWG